MTTYTVKVWGYDEPTQREALLEEHDFTDLGEARECERRLVRSGAGLVTFNSDGTARTQVRDAELRVYDADPAEGDASDMYVMEVLGVTVRVRKVQGFESAEALVTVEADGPLTIADA